MQKRVSILLVAVVLLSTVSLFIGVKEMTFIELLRMNPEQLQLFFISRLPRLLSVLCVSISLPVAGVIMQLITANQFVSPSTGSTMDWSRLGVLMALLLFPNAGILEKMLLASLMGFLGTLLFIRILHRLNAREAVLVPLIGMLLGSVVGAVSIWIAYRYDLVQNISSWLQGNFALVIRGRYELLYLGIPVLAVTAIFASRFTIASMGRDFSKNLGIGYNATVNLGLALSAVITAVVVVTIGSIPFVGIIIPNLVRLRRGDALKDSLPEISLTGALFLLVCDILSRIVMFPAEVPVSVTAGALGCVGFLYMIIRRKRHAAA